MITRIQPNNGKTFVIGTSEFWKKRDILALLFLMPSAQSVLEGIIGIYLAEEELLIYSSSEPYAIWLILLYGYFSCFVYARIARNQLNKKAEKLNSSWILIGFIGISFLLAYISGYMGINMVMERVYEDFTRDSLLYDNIYSTATIIAFAQLLSFIFGGFLIVRSFSKEITMPKPISPIMREQISPARHTITESVKKCSRCGKGLPERARFCDVCAYPVSIPQQEEVTFKRVSFREAVDLLDSESYRRGTRMNIEFECVVKEPASPEQYGGPAPYRTIRVTDPAGLFSRTLYVWGDPGHRHNINLVESLKQKERILINGPRRPKDSPYYKDAEKKDVFWIERWDGTISDTGTRLLKLEDISAMKVEEPPVSEKGPDVIEAKTEAFAPETKTMAPPFYCQLCSIKHPAGTPRMQCEACGRYLCVDAFAEMAKVGRTSCPMCDGKLTSI